MYGPQTRAGNGGTQLVDFIQSAKAILTSSEKRLEAAANNVANMTTPGFKTQKLYSSTLAGFGAGAALPTTFVQNDFEQGKLVKTANALDLAIGGRGYFALSSAQGLVYSRQGQFRLSADGRVLNAQGLALQQADGGDLILSSSDILITADGTVISEGRPVAKIGLFEAVSGTGMRSNSGSLFAIDSASVRQVDEPDIRQGMTEASNVALADEMVSVMASLRNAEGGARLVQTYDDLMGKAITTFGQGGR